MASQPPPGGRAADRTHRQRLGARGEQLAADWYTAQGYTVVARDGELVFCEVKTRSSDRFGVPAEAVTWAKQRRLRVLAARYLAEHTDPAAPRRRGVRFDVASVMAGEVEVIEAAF